MKHLLIIFLLLPSIIFGQYITTTEQGGQNNIYNNALKQYLSHVSKFDKIKIDTLFIEQNEIITDSLQSSINGTFLKKLNWTEINIQLDQKLSIVLYKLFPLSFDKGQFFVSIIPYSTYEKGGEVNLIYSGACKIIYSFDKNTKRFKFSKVVCWGI